MNKLQRKRLLARKEMDHAYKKNAKFTEASKNPLLAALENLLSGKAEKDLLNQDAEAKKNLNSTLLTEVDTLTQSEVKGNLKESQIVASEESIQTALTSASEEVVQELEKVRDIAFTSTTPFPQDFRIAAMETTSNQAVNGELLEEKELEEESIFVGDSLDVEVPERFLSEVKRDVEAPTVFGKDLEKELFLRTFSKAKSTYSTHIAMVNNSYRLYNEPQFSIAL